VLADRDAYDFIYFPNVFIAEANIRTGLVRSLAALRPGGWLTLAANAEGAPPPVVAMFRLRETQWGGPCWDARGCEAALREAGFVDSHVADSPPTAIVKWVVGRKPA